jgi:hypothetical protein
LAFHRGCETVEFGADGCVDPLAAQLDDDSAEDGGIDVRIDGDVAAGAGAELCLEDGNLVVVEGSRCDDLRGRLAAMLRGEPAEGADHAAKLVLAPVLRQDAEELGGDRIQLKLGSKRSERLAGFVAGDQRADDQLRELLRIEQCLVERVEAAADGIDLPFVTREIEQSGGVTPR